MSLKYLNILWQLLELRLINCKGELKLKWMKHCVLASSGLKNNMLTLTKLFLLSKTQNYISLLSYYLLKTTKTVEQNEYKTKSENENMNNECRYFL